MPLSKVSSMTKDCYLKLRKASMGRGRQESPCLHQPNSDSV